MLLNIRPEEWIWLVISVLSVWRLTSLLCFDAGPFDLMVRLRRVLVTIRLGSLISCFECTSLWISALVTLIVYHVAWSSLPLIFAIAGGASLLERAVGEATSLEEEDHAEN